MLILDQLQRIWQSLVNKRLPCEVEEESIDHIFLHYVKTSVLLQLSFFFVWHTLGDIFLSERDYLRLG